MLDLYIRGDSPIHRTPAGLKLVLLAVAGAGLFFVEAWPILFVCACGAAGLAALARLPAGALWRQLRPLLLFVGVLVLAQLLARDLATALVVFFRLVTLLVLALLVTLTTRASEMVETIERALAPLDGWISVEKVSLAISLALRFIPVLARMVAERREAQWARGQERSMVALATPLIISTLKMADQIAEALEARGFGINRSEPTRNASATEPPTGSCGS